MVDLVSWKKVIKDKILKNKKIFLFFSLCFGLIVGVYVFSLYREINSLQNTKKMSDLELRFLRTSAEVTKTSLTQDHDELVSLKARFERILNGGPDDITEEFTNMQIPTSKLTSPTLPPNISNKTPLTDYSVQQEKEKTSVDSTSSIGTVEIYSSAGKKVPFYENATTVSSQTGHIETGAVIPYVKITSGWYQVKVSESQLAWIPEQNIRRTSN